MSKFFNTVALTTFIIASADVMASEAVEPALKKLSLSEESETPPTAPPQLKELDAYEFRELKNRANMRDENAQREIITRHRYGFLKEIYSTDIVIPNWTLLHKPEEDPDVIEFILSMYKDKADQLWPKLNELLGDRCYDYEKGNLTYLPYEYLFGLASAVGLSLHAPDLVTAACFYKTASDAGYPRAHLAYAGLLERDINTGLFTRGITDQEGPVRIALIERHKQGHSEKYAQAVSLYKKAADAGFLVALVRLADLYLDKGIHIDPALSDRKVADALAIEILKHAAEKGLYDAQIRLNGYYYGYLSSVLNDTDKRRWQARLAPQGHDTSAFALWDYYFFKNPCEAMRIALNPGHKMGQLIGSLPNAFQFDEKQPRRKPDISVPAISEDSFLHKLSYFSDTFAGLTMGGMLPEYAPCLHESIEALQKYSIMLCETRSDLYLPLLVTSFSCTYPDQTIAKQHEPQFLHRAVIKGTPYLTLGVPYVKKAVQICVALNEEKETPDILVNGPILAAYAQSHVASKKGLEELHGPDLMDLAYRKNTAELSIRTLGQARGALKKILRAYTDAINIGEGKLEGFKWARSTDVLSKQKQTILEETLQELTNNKEHFKRLSVLFENSANEIHDLIRNPALRNGASDDSIYFKTLSLALAVPGVE